MTATYKHPKVERFVKLELRSDRVRCDLCFEPKSNELSDEEKELIATLRSVIDKLAGEPVKSLDEKIQARIESLESKNA